ncbi:Copper type II ascorbate-dependent monooxygenase, C-terminal domain [Singulisphaera sp. GP187]|uniref:monooxygenase n=1 Tax=Singulisphaera sp. GP187 TaxID=1882752 RepID=UPI0009277F77|nr:ascorbate-dependent monooxygenase [Singulisphaera sp. GP187]SIO21317.1 Copper type II ascorbate-dependent monooxygenase, C-terminal domain [Singulisphaera sp. GP187]
MRRWLGSSGMALVMGMSGGAATAAEAPTYHREVVRILQKHCQDCHRPGQVAPFSLLHYDQARKRGADLAAVTADRKMPPWHASSKEGGPFRDARVLSQDEIATLGRWAEAGCPEGAVADAPAPRTWESDWSLGTPDLVLKATESYTLDAEGQDELRVFVLPTGLTEGRWVAAVDFLPGNPKIVHHVLAAFDVRGAAKKLDEADPKPGYKAFGGFGMIPSGGLGGWSPGKVALPLPDGVGRYLPAGSDVLLQVHYHRSGKVESDNTSIGLYFAKHEVDKQVRGARIMPPSPGLFRRPTLLIPAGDAHYEISGTQTINEDSHLIAITPHMHWLGKDFLMKAIRPDGSTVTLIRIDQWDFNWQGAYDFATPVPLPKGTRIEMKAHFDNSAENSANPTSPPVAVHWGEQTTDEMCIGFLQMTVDDEHRKNQPPPRFALPTADRLSKEEKP